MTTTESDRTSVPSASPAADAEDDVQHPLSHDPRHFGIDPGDPWPDDVPRGQDDSHWRYEDDPRERGEPNFASRPAGP